MENIKKDLANMSDWELTRRYKAAIRYEASRAHMSIAADQLMNELFRRGVNGETVEALELQALREAA